MVRIATRLPSLTDDTGSLPANQVVVDLIRELDTEAPDELILERQSWTGMADSNDLRDVR